MYSHLFFRVGMGFEEGFEINLEMERWDLIKKLLAGKMDQLHPQSQPTTVAKTKEA